MKLKSKTLRQTWWLHFPNSQLPFYQYGVYISKRIRSALIFWTGLSCRGKGYSNKATLVLGWNNHYKNYSTVITIWLTLAKYQFLKWQWIFSFIRRLFLTSFSPPKLLQDSTIWVTRWIAYKKRVACFVRVSGLSILDLCPFSFL